MIVVKKLNIKRCKEYKIIRLEALKSDPIAFGSSYEEEEKLPIKEWEKRMNNVLFALDNDKIIGTIVVVFNKWLKTKHVADIYGVYVNKNYRGKGIGNKLIEAALKYIKKNKEIIKIKLSVNSVQKAAAGLYKKYGFEEIGVCKKELKVDNTYYDELLMEKMLK
ncbi:MAG: GNAT family N-acetyltransferase [Candidatus Nanoarchaeia archaeon]|jgi:ribosomal protein S18 acetylase RimI-like enzyme